MNGTEKEILADTLLQLATRFREQAFCRYVKDWPEYQRLLDISCEADRAYVSMELTEKQREQIDFLLNSRLDASECELTLTYVAGVLDGIAFLRNSGFLDMYVTDRDSDEK